jgi:hypothetical protein
MSCPYFDPERPNARAAGSQHSYLPLGDAWTGTCRADARHPDQPDEASMLSLCNIGYARGTCPRFPAEDAGPDAARFTIAADDGASLRIYYVLERDHKPFAHGPLDCAAGESTFHCNPAGDLTAKQALAYLASYLKRKACAGIA